MTNPTRKRVVTLDDLNVLNQNAAYARQKGEEASAAAQQADTARQNLEELGVDTQAAGQQATQAAQAATLAKNSATAAALQASQAAGDAVTAAELAEGAAGTANQAAGAATTAAQRVTDAVLDLTDIKVDIAQAQAETQEAGEIALQQAGVQRYATDSERGAAAPANNTWSYTAATRRYHRREAGLWVPRGSQLVDERGLPFVSAEWFRSGSGLLGGQEIQTALDFALAEFGGGEVRLGAGTFTNDGEIQVGAQLNLLGSGVRGTYISNTTAGSRVAFGTRTTGGRGGTSGNFSLRGNGVAAVNLYVGLTVERTFLPIDTMHALTGAILESGQNNTYIGLDVQNNTQNGLILDGGTGGNLFLRSELNANGGYNLIVRQTQPILNPGYNIPTHNTFKKAVIERVSYTAPASTLGMVLVENANSLTFDGVTFASVEAGGNAADLLLDIRNANGGGTSVNLQNCQLTGVIGESTALRVAGGAVVRIDRMTRLQNMRVAYTADSSSQILTSGAEEFNNVQARFEAISGSGATEAVIKSINRNFNRVIRTGPGAVVAQGLVDGETGARFVLYANGEYKLGSGADFTYDVGMRRVAAGTWEFSGKLNVTDDVTLSKRLFMTDLFRSTAATATTFVRQLLVNGEAGARFAQYADGRMFWGDGTTFNYDTTLYRGGADLLKTDDDFQVGNGAWNGQRLRLGNHHLWVDATGNLRIKSSAPTSDTDGTGLVTAGGAATTSVRGTVLRAAALTAAVPTAAASSTPSKAEFDALVAYVNELRTKLVAAGIAT